MGWTGVRNRRLVILLLGAVLLFQNFSLFTVGDTPASSSDLNGTSVDYAGYDSGYAGDGDIDPDAVTSWTSSLKLLSEATWGARLTTYNNYLFLVGGYGSSSVMRAQVQSNGDTSGWSYTTSLPAALGDVGTVAYNGYIYAVGGEDASTIRYNTVYYATIDANGNVGQWNTATPLPYTWTRGELAICNGYLYAVGGVWNDAVSGAVYYTSLSGGVPGSWSATTSLPDVRQRVAFDNLVYNNRIYFPGGSGSGGTSTNTVYYGACSPSGGITSWSTTSAPLPEARSQHTAALDTKSGELYVISGYTTTGVVTTRYGKINPSTGDIASWTPGPDLPAIRRYAGAVFTPAYDVIHVAGGSPDVSQGTNTVYYGKTVTATPPTVTVLSPNGGETLFVGANTLIQWTAQNGSNPFGSNPITIYYSINNGNTWDLLTPGGIANSGSWTWTVNNTPTTEGLVKVVATDTAMMSGSDQSDAKFTIASTPAPMINLLSPSGGEVWRGINEVQWQGASALSSTVTYTISISTDAGNTWTIVGTDQYKESPTFTNHSHTVDSKSYNDTDRARIKIEGYDGTYTTTVLGNNFTIDNTPPKSKVEPLPKYINSTSFTVWWNGTDPAPGSGISNYTIYVAEGSGQMQPWLTNVTTNNGTFSNAVDGMMYKFMSIASDNAGNLEQKPPSTPDAFTTVDISPPMARLDPLPKYSLSDILIYFNASENISGLSKVILYFRVNYGDWSAAGEYTKSPISFTAPGSGTYDFYIIGVDNAGNADSKTGYPEATTTVDLIPPAVTDLKTSKQVYNVTQVATTVYASDDNEVVEVWVEYRYSPDNITWGGWKFAKNQTTSGQKPVVQVRVDLKDGDGYYGLRGGAKDGAGNTAVGSERLVIIDTTPPTVISHYPNGTNIPTSVEARIQFSEPMDKKSVEQAIKIEGRGDGIPVPAVNNITWNTDLTEITFTIEGLLGETTYDVTILGTAKDLVGNRMSPFKFEFTTVPTVGAIVGSVVDDSGNGLSGVAIKIMMGSTVLNTTSGGKGDFEFRGLEPGEYELIASLKDYEEYRTHVKVIAGKETKVTVQMVKSKVYFLGLIGALIAVVVALLLLYILVLKKTKKCPMCGHKVKKETKVCPVCGYRYKVKKRVTQPAKPVHAIEIEGVTTEPAPIQEKAAKLISASAAAPASKVMIRCASCGEETPADDQWCKNCGVMLGVAAKEATECPECGAMIQPGAICTNCGYVPGGVPALIPEKDMSTPRAECPRCYAPIEPGAKFCSVCGADIARQVAKQKAKAEQKAQMKADAMPGAKPMPEHVPPVPYAPPGPDELKEACPRCLAPLEPGAKFCSVCRGDIEKLKQIQKTKEQQKAQMKADAMPGAKPMPEPPKPPVRPQAPVPPPHPSRPGKVCKCGAPLEPGAKWCDICGEKV